MKVLLAYDASSCSKVALRDLKRAGLPPDTECIVLSVSEIVTPVPTAEDPMNVPLASVIYERTTEFTTYSLERARWEAEEAKKELISCFPNWKISVEAEIGSPASIILDKARLHDVDLIIVGSHGRSAIGRAFLGSVSHKIIREAHCSVRIGRTNREEDTELRILVGLDTSEDSYLAFNEVTRRYWPNDTEIQLLSIVDFSPLLTLAYASTAIDPFLVDLEKEKHKELEQYIRSCEEKLKKLNVGVAGFLDTGYASAKLLEHAKTWSVDCVFVGIRGMSRLEGMLLGSVSDALATKASCSVEVIRQKHWHSQPITD